MPTSIRYEKIDDTGLAGPVTEMNGGLMAETTIYVAKRVVTMNPANPSGSAVAVRDGRVLGVGSVDELAAWGEHEIDDRFADKVLTPGFIETHCHSSTGGRWLNPYVGYFDRADPEGVIWKGCKDIFEVIDRLKALEAAMTAEGQPDDELLHVWGLDPLYFDGERMYASHLDTVSATRPIFVHHASGHLATVNSALMRAENITADSMTPGVVKGADGSPNGELQEPAAMSLATKAYAQMAASRMAPEALWNFGYEARNTGTTMVADLGTGTFEDPLVDLWRGIVEDDDFPMRVMLTASNIMGGTAAPAELAARTAELWRSGCSDKLRFGIVKLILDGSIQGFTARISYPHHYTVPGDSSDNGLWLTAPDQIADILDPYHRAGLT
ncbi:MAG: amidohydrolase family protein, partial [Actinomycetota bacterium]|nr:amidohydrolase family protein [Actinomycetota bacterium]